MLLQQCGEMTGYKIRFLCRHIHTISMNSELCAYRRWWTAIKSVLNSVCVYCKKTRRRDAD